MRDLASIIPFVIVIVWFFVLPGFIKNWKELKGQSKGIRAKAEKIDHKYNYRDLGPFFKISKLDRYDQRQDYYNYQAYGLHCVTSFPFDRSQEEKTPLALVSYSALAQ